MTDQVPKPLACEHGRLARQCEICQLQAELSELRQLYYEVVDQRNKALTRVKYLEKRLIGPIF